MTTIPIKIDFWRRDGRIIRTDWANSGNEARRMIASEFRRNSEIDSASFREGGKHRTLRPKR